MTRSIAVVVAVLLAGACSADGLDGLDATRPAIETTAAPEESTTTTPAVPPLATTPPPTPPDGVGDNPVPLVHVFPVEPASAASYSDGGHAYPATDVFAPEGSAFVAVVDGRVDALSTEDRWDPATDDPALRGGRFVAIVGDDGVRYYGSHLAEVEKGLEGGDRVIAGQRLGSVGRSGNARDTPAHLHFGISKPTFAEDWEARRGQIAPRPFLDAWRSGDATAAPSVDLIDFVTDG